MSGRKPKRATVSPPSREKPGRPRIWEGDKLQAVLDKLREGLPLALACRLQGHEPDSLEELMARDVEMRGLIEQARSFGQEQLFTQLLATAEGPVVRAREWALERLNPKVFGQRSKVENEHTGKEGAPIAVEITLADAVELAKP